MFWITAPLTFYALLSTGIILCLYLFVLLKQEAANARLMAEHDKATVAAQVEELRNSILQLQVELRQLKLESESHVLATPPYSGDLHSVNVGKRSLALRMHRHGDTPEKIATTLHIPKNEVDLMLKVHQMVVDPVLKTSAS